MGKMFLQKIIRVTANSSLTTTVQGAGHNQVANLTGTCSYQLAFGESFKSKIKFLYVHFFSFVFASCILELFASISDPGLNYSDKSFFCPYPSLLKIWKP